MPETTTGPADADGPGPLLVIGGAEDKLRKRTILKEFVARSGGPDARIAVIPTASSLGDEVVEVYDALFRRLGAGEVMPVRPESRDEAHDPELVEAVGEATGVFMTGGNQLKLSAVICGTPLGDAIADAPTAEVPWWRARRPGPASSPRTWSPSASGVPPPSSG